MQLAIFRIADYWRWFAAHIWVDSIFEFFGLAVIALFLLTLGRVSARSALRAAYLSAILVFISGIPGTAHHYFFLRLRKSGATLEARR